MYCRPDADRAAHRRREPLGKTPDHALHDLNHVPPSEYADAVAAASKGEARGAYTRALIEAGVFVGGNALHPPHTATTLRVRGEGREIQDGPHAASKEQFGGYYIIDVPDLDAALHWAALNPAARSGAVEVRPVATRRAA